MEQKGRHTEARLAGIYLFQLFRFLSLLQAKTSAAARMMLTKIAEKAINQKYLAFGAWARIAARRYGNTPSIPNSSCHTPPVADFIRVYLHCGRAVSRLTTTHAVPCAVGASTDMGTE